MANVSLSGNQTYADIVRSRLSQVDESYCKDSFLENNLVRFISRPENNGASELVRERTHVEQYAHRSVGEDSEARELRVQEGFSKQITPVKYDAKITFTYEFRKLANFSMRQEKKEELMNITNVIPRAVDLDLANFVSQGFGTSFVDMDGISRDTTGADGVSAFNNAHPLPSGVATTWRNTVAGNPAITPASLEQLGNYYNYQVFDNFGKTMRMKADVVFTTVDETSQNDIRRILLSNSGISDPNSGVYNPLKGRYRHVVLERLDQNAYGQTDLAKTKYWGLVASGMTDLTLVNFAKQEVLNPTEDNNRSNASTGSMTVVTRELNGIAWVSSKAWVMSKGDGTP
jgi:hypothetical protein